MLKLQSKIKNKLLILFIFVVLSCIDGPAVLAMPQNKLTDPVSNIHYDYSGSSTVATGTSGIGQTGRQLTYDNGYWWVFYSARTNFYYKSSADGINWNAASQIDNQIYYDQGIGCSIWRSGHDVHVVWTGDDIIYYKKGSLENNGSISWSGYGRQTVESGYYDYWLNPSICLDSNGYPNIIAWSENGEIHHWISSTNNGQWTGDFYSVKNGLLTIGMATIIPMGDGQLCCVWGGRPSYNTIPKAKVWNGSSWGSEETIDSYLASTSIRYITGTYYDNTTYIGIDPASFGIPIVYKRSANGTWSVSDNPQGEDNGETSLTLDEATGDIYNYYDEYISGNRWQTKITKYTNISGTWGDDVLIADNNYVDRSTTNAVVENNYIGLLENNSGTLVLRVYSISIVEDQFSHIANIGYTLIGQIATKAIDSIGKIVNISVTK